MTTTWPSWIRAVVTASRVSTTGCGNVMVPPSLGIPIATLSVCTLNLGRSFRRIIPSRATCGVTSSSTPTSLKLVVPILPPPEVWVSSWYGSSDTILMFAVSLSSTRIRGLASSLALISSCLAVKVASISMLSFKIPKFSIPLLVLLVRAMAESNAELIKGCVGPCIFPSASTYVFRPANHSIPKSSWSVLEIS
ncbi:MAG: hypothetical protein BWY71_02036 [Planctomycetes bacterium ADurb.Bin412]|nr:MAG: hypothetical protein BWY71_02036 [Planctomycetes bacterium ADurb.Bin412]